MSQGRGGSSEWELRVPGVGVLDWTVLGHGGGCSGGNQGCSGCSWRVLEVAGEGMESAWGQSGGCLGWEWRVLGDWRVLEGGWGRNGGCLGSEWRVLRVSLEGAQSRSRGYLG